MKHKYSTTTGKSNGLSSSYIFSTAIQRTCQTPSPPLPLWQSVIKIFLQRQMSKCFWGYASHPQWESDQSTGLLLPVLTHRPPWIPLAAFQLQQDDSLSLSVASGHQPNTSCIVNSAKKTPKHQRQERKRDVGHSTMAGLMEGRILPHCVRDDEEVA